MKLTNREKEQILKQRRQEEAIEEAKRTAHLERQCQLCNGRGSTGYFGPYMDKDDYVECQRCGGKGRWQVTQAQHDKEMKEKIKEAESRVTEAQRQLNELKRRK